MRRTLTLLAALLALALFTAGCGDDDGDDGGGDSAGTEETAGPLTIDVVQSNLEDAGYTVEVLSEGEASTYGAEEALRVGSEEDDGGFFGGYVFLYEEPVDEADVAENLGSEPFDVAEGGIVFNSYGPDAEESLETLVEASGG